MTMTVMTVMMRTMIMIVVRMVFPWLYTHADDDDGGTGDAADDSDDDDDDDDGGDDDADDDVITVMSIMMVVVMPTMLLMIQVTCHMKIVMLTLTLTATTMTTTTSLQATANELATPHFPPAEADHTRQAEQSTPPVSTTSVRDQ